MVYVRSKVINCAHKFGLQIIQINSLQYTWLHAVYADTSIRNVHSRVLVKNNIFTNVNHNVYITKIMGYLRKQHIVTSQKII